MSTKKIVTVFGATGRQGGGAVKYLTADGTFHVRAVTRNPDSDAARALAALGAEIVKADLNDKASIVAAMKGAYGVFGVTDFWQPDIGPREEVLGKMLVDAAKETGVQHFVWSTLEHSDLNILHVETKAKVDDYLRESGVPRTSLYTAFFLENIAHPHWSLKRDSDGTLIWDVVPFVTDGVIAAIAAADCGVIAAIALKNPERFIGQDIFAATEFTTPRKMAMQVEDFLGERVKVKEFGMQEFDEMEAGRSEMPVMQSEIWAMVKWYYVYCETRRSIPDTLAILPNPRTFKQVLEEKGKAALLPK